MDHFGGLDVSVKRRICIVDDTGRITKEVKCPSADNLRLVRRFAKGGSGSSGLSLSGLQLMLQASDCDSYTLDAFTLGEDNLGPAGVDVGRG